MTRAISYHNLLVALDATRSLNNGLPGSLARWIQALDLKTEDRVFHLGCGVGYYTAIMADVVGPDGSVVACVKWIPIWPLAPERTWRLIQM